MRRDGCFTRVYYYVHRARVEIRRFEQKRFRVNALFIPPSYLHETYISLVDKRISRRMFTAETQIDLTFSIKEVNVPPYHSIYTAIIYTTIYLASCHERGRASGRGKSRRKGYRGTRDEELNIRDAPRESTCIKTEIKRGDTKRAINQPGRKSRANRDGPRDASDFFRNSAEWKSTIYH